jgi:hypothetical protein
VLGLRLDNDRRAWIEDTAAQQGVSVRAVFEALIDRARAEEAQFATFITADDVRGGIDGTTAGAGSRPEGAAAEHERAGATGGFASDSMPVVVPLVLVGRALAVSGQVLHMAASIAAALFETSGEFARTSWRIVTQGGH